MSWLDGLQKAALSRAWVQGFRAGSILLEFCWDALLGSAWVLDGS